MSTFQISVILAIGFVLMLIGANKIAQAAEQNFSQCLAEQCTTKQMGLHHFSQQIKRK